jgi:hypothetical protein
MQLAPLHLGPAILTRLLERPLLAAAAAGGVANVVHVSSVTHRYAAIPDVSRFLTSWWGCSAVESAWFQPLNL